MFSAALVNLKEGQPLYIATAGLTTDHTTSRFKHVPLAFGSMLCVQKYLTGVQLKIALKMVQHEYAVMNAIKP
jgi:hypothetical protein